MREREYAVLIWAVDDGDDDDEDEEETAAVARGFTMASTKHSIQSLNMASPARFWDYITMATRR